MYSKGEANGQTWRKYVSRIDYSQTVCLTDEVLHLLNFYI